MAAVIGAAALLYVHRLESRRADNEARIAVADRLYEEWSSEEMRQARHLAEARIDFEDRQPYRLWYGRATEDERRAITRVLEFFDEVRAQHEAGAVSRVRLAGLMQPNALWWRDALEALEGRSRVRRKVAQNILLAGKFLVLPLLYCTMRASVLSC